MRVFTDAGKTELRTNLENNFATATSVVGFLNGAGIPGADRGEQLPVRHDVGVPSNRGGEVGVQRQR